ncbi:MAG TPA: ATP-binding protein [Candidatus Paceibacterota bacterium]|nr:ATP-binding protein [Verrucomicrobiota bacterium]HRY58615.1 ATP-binding protein [Candidatus Paceibacterota bacterium]HNR70567.1 ATP-binding protein [Verrucomicrobiota bacterium]HNS69165.1 ATP-binding protein [Verrucomicrobiota bacterium]HQE88955.1 ATP-binding protein [Verrucomicrobiota bacterium]
MELSRRSLLVYGLLGALWVLVLGWQTQEHVRVREAARTGLRNRAKDIANTLSAIIRGMRFRGVIPQERLEPVLNELIHGRTNELIQSSELLSIVLLNATNQPVASAGQPIDLQRKDLLQEGEHWGARSVTLVNPVDLGASLSALGVTNTVILPLPGEFTNRGSELGHEFTRRGPPPPEEMLPPRTPPPPDAGEFQPGGRPGRTREPGSRPRRPFWLRGMAEEDFQSLVAKQTLHGLVLTLSTEGLAAAITRDLWLRTIIVALAGLSVLGSALAWRNLAKSSELQIRLVRTSEMNTRLKEMNLAAAGLAHETRNPLNIIRGLAQMISRQTAAPAEIQERSRAIIAEADKVAAQLNEFINYSRPREIRRTRLALNAVLNEVVRALNYDLEEKQINLQIKGEPLTIEADEQSFRQALFNLLLNAIQAVEPRGEIQIAAEKRNAAEATLEVRDNGPGVPPGHRAEIFKPYFTTQKQGTGLGLAVVQQIVLAHGWEVECLPHEPRGAIFRISHLKLAA